MAATGYTPIYLYYSGTATNVPLAANLGAGELAINAADGNLFYKNTSNAVVTIPVLQSSATQSGWLSSTDWSTFNGKQPAGTYVTSVTGTAPVVSSGGTTPAISMAAATSSVNGYLTSTDWSTFNGKQAALVSGTNIKTVNGTSLLGSGDVGTIDVAHGGTGATTLTSGYFLQGNGTSAVSTSTKLYTDGSNLFSECYYKATVQSGATANTAPTGLIVSNKTTGTAATGFGSALEFNYQDTSGGYAGGKIASLAGADIFTASMAFYPRNYGYAEAMRIWSSGGVSIGNTTDPGATNLSVTGSALVGKTSTAETTTGWYFNSTGAGNCKINSGYFVWNRDTDDIIVNFRRSNSSVGTISVTTTNTAYNTSSDYRLKENVQSIENALDTVSLLNPVTYDWKINGSQGIGFIAHELQSVIPQAVTGAKDAVDEEGNPVYQGVDASFLIATLTKAIQELNAKVSFLESRMGDDNATN